MQTLRSLLAPQNSLRELADRYSSFCWANWKAQKQIALSDETNPFLGGLDKLVAANIKSLPLKNGQVEIVTTQRIVQQEVGTVNYMEPTRIRFQDLTSDSREILERVYGKKIPAMAKGGADVIHPEFTATYEENVVQSPTFRMNNFVSAAAALDALTTYLTDETTTVGQMMDRIENLLSGSDTAAAQLITLSSRAAWIARACMNGSWKVSADFSFFFNLGKNVQEIDRYVVTPVLEAFLQDLRSGYFTQPLTASGD